MSDFDNHQLEVMYCPKCGNVLEEKDGTFRCVRGDMPLSAPFGNEAVRLFCGQV